MLVQMAKRVWTVDYGVPLSSVVDAGADCTTNSGVYRVNIGLHLVYTLFTHLNVRIKLVCDVVCLRRTFQFP